MTRWRRLREWQEAGVWQKIHQVLLDHFGEAQAKSIGCGPRWTQRVCLPPQGGPKLGQNPTDRGKSGAKRHVVADRKGIPLTIVQSVADVHDSKMF